MKFKFLSKDKTPHQKLRFGAGLVQHRALLWCWVSRLPKNPGVYAFKKGAKFLYIGKAANIRERVKNHFRQFTPYRIYSGAGPTAYRDNLFINQVKKIGFIKTGSEIEALILEANLIKKYQPKYNIVWHDDKNYFFVGITKEDFPRIFITHQTKSIYNLQFTIYNFVGPFVDGKALKQTLKVLRKIFPYRSCKTLPKRACLFYHLNRCPAPCLLKSKIYLQIPGLKKKIQKKYQRNVKNLIKILQGRKTQVLKDLKKVMKKLAKIQDFERAAKIRDQITYLEKVLAHSRVFGLLEPPQKVDWYQIQKSLCRILKTNPPKFCKAKFGRARIEAYDISNIQGEVATGSMVTFINGLPNKDFYRKFKIKIAGKPDDIAMIKECLNRRFKHSEWGWPDLILIDGGIAQLNAARSVIKPYSRKSVKPFVMALAKKNNELFLETQKKPLLLKKLPRGIFNLILQLRDEAHRFARKYHLKLREIDTFD